MDDLCCERGRENEQGRSEVSWNKVAILHGVQTSENKEKERSLRNSLPRGDRRQ